MQKNIVVLSAICFIRELLSNTQMELKKMTEEYADTVPRRDYDTCETKYYNLSKAFDKLEEEYKLLRHTNKRLKGNQVPTYMLTYNILLTLTISHLTAKRIKRRRIPKLTLKLLE